MGSFPFPRDSGKSSKLFMAHNFVVWCVLVGKVKGKRITLSLDTRTSSEKWMMSEYTRPSHGIMKKNSFFVPRRNTFLSTLILFGSREINCRRVEPQFSACNIVICHSFHSIYTISSLYSALMLNVEFQCSNELKLLDLAIL